jgi:glutamyl-Q tRNA(Asp) synthetase
MHWDEPIIYQSQRRDGYEAVLLMLRGAGVIYPGACSRKEIADSALYGIEGQIYPGSCRNAVPAGREGRAWRVRTNNAPISIEDTLQGAITQCLESELGDFVVRGADGLFAYQMAVVIDDAFQKITHVVRGADLLNSAPRQIYLQRLFGTPSPRYMHIPVAVNAVGEKLSKQTLAALVNRDHTTAVLWDALKFLQRQPPRESRSASIEGVAHWGIGNWQPLQMLGMRALKVPNG